jgi:ABC-type transporter Mla MlaB component
MVFSFFKKQPNKMPERPAARPRPVEPLPEVKPPPAEVRSRSSRSPSRCRISNSRRASRSRQRLPEPSRRPCPAQPAGGTASPAAPAASDDFSIDDFDSDFTNSSVMGIDVDHDVDPLQSCVEQVVVLYANGQDGAARSLLETFVRSYRGVEGKRFWMLLFDLLQISGDRAAFEKLGVDYAEACECSPPTWRQELPSDKPVAGMRAGNKIFLQGVDQRERLARQELAKLIAQKAEVQVECAKLIGCDDEIAAILADLLGRARKQRLAISLLGAEAFMDRLNERLVAGEAAHEAAWRLLLELLQRHGTQERFEERAVDYAMTFELSPPSWETLAEAGRKAAAIQRQR